MTRLALALLALGLLAAGESARFQLRYRPDPGSTWLTEGRLSVKSWTRLPEGESTASEDQELAWVDTVTARDVAGTVTLTRVVRKWSPVGQTQSLLPSDPTSLLVSKLGEQRPVRGASLLDQPAFLPTRNVEVGESWPVEQTVTGEVPVGSQVMKVETRTQGKATFTRLGPGLAVLDLALTIDQKGQSPSVGTVSASQVRWTIHVDVPTGVPVWQKMESKTEQTITLPNATVPSRSETLLELTTKPG